MASFDGYTRVMASFDGYTRAMASFDGYTRAMASPALYRRSKYWQIGCNDSNNIVKVLKLKMIVEQTKFRNLEGILTHKFICYRTHNIIRSI